MRLLSFFISVCLLLCGTVVNAQSLGQDPWTAYPVCGTGKFEQKLVPIQAGRPMPSPCPSSDGLADINPYYYRFTAYTTGSLGFEITPLADNDDYDWQLFDITNHDPSEIFTNGTLFVACNWSGFYGKTGASTQGRSLVSCAGNAPIWSSMPTVTKGHVYLLMVSHFLDNQNGYTLEFKGGSASIYDPLEPAVTSVKADCSGLKLSVLFNKKLRCNSLASNGSDFKLDVPGFSILSAKSIQCSRGFDMDSVELTLDKPLPVGNYKLFVKTGSDGNRVVDYCDRPVDSALQIPFSILPLLPTPMDSLVKPVCAPTSIELVFKKNIACNSVSLNGSEFSINGPRSVAIAGVSVACTGNLTNRIIINFSQPIFTGGTYTVTLGRGADGNSLLDECSQETPVGSLLTFAIKDTVSAAFSIEQFRGCEEDTFYFRHDGRNGVSSWAWNLPDQTTSVLQRPVYRTSATGTSTVGLVVTNGFCSDTALSTISSNIRVTAAFTGSSVVCPNDGGQFTDASSGPVTRWSWDFGNGQISSVQNPPVQTYTPQARDRQVRVSLMVEDEAGCTDTAQQNILVVSSCIIAVPNAFTPNNDGRNDYLYPSNAYKAENLMFRVFNRYGQLVFETRDWTKKWDGRMNGRDLSEGTYVWTLQFRNRDTGLPFNLKGTTLLLR